MPGMPESPGCIRNAHIHEDSRSVCLSLQKRGNGNAGVHLFGSNSPVTAHNGTIERMHCVWAHMVEVGNTGQGPMSEHSIQIGDILGQG